jgi:hypothetical protein
MSEQRETVEYEGRQRQVHGRLRYPEQQAPGTLVGPSGMGDTLVILGPASDGATLLGLAITDDMERAKARVKIEGPASMHEQRLMRRYGA